MRDDMNLAVVLPNEPKYAELFTCMQQVKSMYAWFSVYTEKNLERSLFEREDQAIVFFGMIPPWVPLQTEAEIGLYFMGYTTNRSSDCEEEFSYFMNWKKLAPRADIVFVRDPIQQDRLRNFLQNVRIVQPGFYNTQVMGAPNFGNSAEIMMSKRLGVISTGVETGRRKKIIQALKDSNIGKHYTHIPHVSRHDRTKLFNSAQAVLHIRKCEDDYSADPFFVSEVLPSTAAMIVEDHPPYPIDSDLNGEAIQIVKDLEYGKSSAFEYISMYATQSNSGQRMAKKAFLKYADPVFQTSRMMSELLRTFPCDD